MPSATSGTNLYTSTRDSIITRALRICGAIGQGETPQTAAITEGAEALNDLVKEWNADGMPLWKITNDSIVLTAGTAAYIIGTGQTINQPAPLKMLQGWLHDVTNPTAPFDSPMIIITKQDYSIYGSKTAQARPSQFLYYPPGANTGLAGTTQDFFGTVTLYPVPDTITAVNCTFTWIGQYSFQDFNASTDLPDFPSYWVNAIKWGLAAELTYEYGVGLSERAMIEKKAAAKKDLALSYGTEEGSLYIWPRAQYNAVGGTSNE